MKAIKNFSFDIVIPDLPYPMNETCFIRYYLVSYVGSSCRLHRESASYMDCYNDMLLRNELRPDLKFSILKCIVNLQLIKP